MQVEEFPLLHLVPRPFLIELATAGGSGAFFSYRHYISRAGATSRERPLVVDIVHYRVYLADFSQRSIFAIWGKGKIDLFSAFNLSRFYV